LSGAHSGLVCPGSEALFAGPHSPTPRKPLALAGSARAARGSWLRACPTHLRRCAHLRSARGYPGSSSAPTTWGCRDHQGSERRNVDCFQILQLSVLINVSYGRRLCKADVHRLRNMQYHSPPNNSCQHLWSVSLLDSWWKLLELMF